MNDQECSPFTNWRNHICGPYANANLQATYDPYLDINRIFGRNDKASNDGDIQDIKEPRNNHDMKRFKSNMARNDVPYFSNEEKEQQNEERCELFDDPAQGLPVELPWNNTLTNVIVDVALMKGIILDILLGWDGAVKSTQEYMKKVVEDVGEDEEFKSTILGTIHHKVIGEGGYEKDITVEAALILANVSVFSPKPSMHYLNITMRNVVKVFRKDTVSGSESGCG
ncbi:AAA+ ATPase domain-containing protein [Tanacetum coccineum]